VISLGAGICIQFWSARNIPLAMIQNPVKNSWYQFDVAEKIAVFRVPVPRNPDRQIENSALPPAIDTVALEPRKEEIVFMRSSMRPTRRRNIIGIIPIYSKKWFLVRNGVILFMAELISSSAKLE